MISKRTLILRMARVMAVFSFLALVSAGCANSESSSSNGGENGSGENGGGEGGEGGGGEGGGGEGGGNGGGNGGGGSHHGGGDGPGGGGNGGGEGGGGEGGGGEGGEGGGGEGGGGEGGGSVCVNGAKDCSETDGIPLLCEDGSWVAQEACQGNLVCLAGDCIKGSSCASPIVLNVGETITGSTVGGESRRTGANCEYKYETPEAVVKVNVPETGYYQFNVESTTGGNWAYYASPVCDGDDMVWPLTADWCGGSAVSDNFRKLLPEGEFYIFFESKDGNESKFSVTFDKAADQRSYVCYNGREYPVTNPTLDLSSGTVSLTNQRTGVDVDSKQPDIRIESACKLNGQSTKAEAVYPFFLDREAQLKAKVTNIKPVEEGKSYKAVVYLASCKENLGNVTINEAEGNRNECTVSTQNAETSELSSGTLPAGLYNLIVDATMNDITFDLEVSIVGATE